MTSPIKALNDSRKYQLITLDNKLQCLLVSDKSTDKSAAAMSVRVGSFYDTIQGIAHFLEHMLFLGTDKYPNQADYSTFVTANSGSNNAFTAELETNYLFDISNSAFEGGLDRFAQFFISPCFTESCTERELNAVDSEHSKNILSDIWRWWQLFKSSSAPGHPYNSFGTGNKETLNIPTVREELLKFYNKYYSSNIMKLVLYGKEDIETME